jgi:hypothetical protein
MDSNTNENQSEVARLLKQFDDEHKAAKLAMQGLAYGTSIHTFITAKMEAMGKVREDLAELVGEKEATQLIIEQWQKGE